MLFSKYGIFEGNDKAALDQANTQVSLLVRAFLQSEASIGKVVSETLNYIMTGCQHNMN